MPNCDFYAAEADFNQILDFVFASCECQVFETYSPFDDDLAQFNSSGEIGQRYAVGRCPGTAPSVLLSLVPPSGRTLVTIRRIELKAGSVPGARYRHTLEGWGTISLQLGGIGPKGLVHSHSNHNSEKRARAWSSTHPEWKAVDEWNWPEVARVSSRLNTHIRERLAVSKIGSRPVLREAAALLNNGTKAV